MRSLTNEQAFEGLLPGCGINMSFLVQQLTQPFLENSLAWTLRAAMQPLMNSFAGDSVGYATTDFNVQFGYQPGFALMLFERSNSEGGGFKQALRFHLYRVSDAFSIDE